MAVAFVDRSGGRRMQVECDIWKVFREPSMDAFQFLSVGQTFYFNRVPVGCVLYRDSQKSNFPRQNLALSSGNRSLSVQPKIVDKV